MTVNLRRGTGCESIRHVKKKTAKIEEGKVRKMAREGSCAEAKGVILSIVRSSASGGESKRHGRGMKPVEVYKGNHCCGGSKEGHQH